MQSNSSFNKMVLWVLALIVIVNVIVVGSLVFKRGNVGAPASSYAIALTQEVHVFSGTVTALGNNSITVEFMPLVNELSPTPQQKYSLNIKTDKNTQVTEEVISIPYYYKNTALEPPSKAAKLSDIKKGDTIRVNAVEDLRLIKNTSVTAQNITILPTGFSIAGTVEKVSGTTVTVKGLKHTPALGPNLGDYQSFTIRTTADTEIVLLPVVAPDAPVPAPKPQKVFLSALKPGMQVNVYAQNTQDNTSSTVQALAIQAQAQAEAPQQQPEAQPTSGAQQQPEPTQQIRQETSPLPITSTP